jgi:sigma-B regulation protein RsbU (phosphoserine phosphatase)
MPRYYLVGALRSTPLRFDLTSGTYSVGRATDCQIVIKDGAVSRNHAEIVVQEDEIRVRDLDSLNGTQVNGRAVHGEAVLSAGDRVKFGQATLTLQEEKESILTGRTDSTTAGLYTEDRVRPTLTTTLHEIKEQSSRGHRSERLLAAVSDAGQLLSRRMQMTEIYKAVLDLLERVLPVSRILILGSKVEEQEILASRTQTESADAPLRMSRTMLRGILKDGKSFVTADAATDAQWDARGSIVQLGVRAAMGAPLFDNDRILGALYVDSRLPGVTYNEEHLHLLTLLANMVAVKMTNSRLEAEEQALEGLRQELAVAARIQRNLLPAVVPECEGMEIFAHQEPCDDIGGDFYDLARREDGKLWAVLGDVTGHGIAAALLMAHVMAGLHILEEQCEEPLALVSRLEAFLAPRVELGQFVTLFVGLLDPETGGMEYVNAGSTPPLVLSGEGTEVLPNTGPPVAVLKDIQPRTSKSVELGAGRGLLLYSDGISEFTRANVQYDEGPMQAFLQGAISRSAQDLGHSMLKDLQAFGEGDPADDDLTLLVIRRI